LPFIFGDFVLIEQVFRNIIENACKYTPVNSPIEIVAKLKDSSRIDIEISDKGPGIKTNPPELIFEKFFRGSTKPGGTGLGLTISKAIVELHGGTIKVRNNPNGGASFTITLLSAPQHEGQVR